MDRVVRSAVERGRIVEAYKSSGLSAASFASQANISRATLYQWVTRAKAQNTDVPVIRVARVVRRRRPRQQAEKAPQEHGSRGPKSTAAITMEVGAVKVHVPPGVDATTLALVLNLLEERGRHGRMQ